MIDVVLVNTNFPTIKEPPLGILYLASFLRINKINVDIIDGSVLDLSKRQLADKIVKRNSKIVGFTCTTSTYSNCQEVARIVKDNLPGIKIIFGGPHPTFKTNEVLINKFVDFVVRNEGEHTLHELVKAILENKTFENIKGLSYKNNKNIKHNPSRNLIKNLDEIPFPARDLVPIKDYEIDFNQGELVNQKSTTIITSRGCPFHCSYCSSAEFWGHNPRMRSVDNIIKEIKEIKNKFGFQNVVFQDDIFTFNMEATKKLCKKIIKEKLNIRWSCSTRVDFLDEDLLNIMKKSGCINISLGVESASEKIIKHIKKALTLEKIEVAIKLCKKFDISTSVYIQFGLPGESNKTIRETFDFLKKIDPDKILISFTTLYPGTDLYKECERKKKIESHVYDEYILGVNPGHGLGAHLAKFITPKKMVEIFKKARREFGDKVIVYKLYDVK